MLLVQPPYKNLDMFDMPITSSFLPLVMLTDSASVCTLLTDFIDAAVMRLNSLLDMWSLDSMYMFSNTWLRLLELECRHEIQLSSLMSYTRILSCTFP